MPTVLLTGFEPFEGEPINPSWEAVRALDGERFGDAAIAVRQMPCVFGAAIDAMAQAIDALDPVLVIAVGQAGGRSEMSVERVAINVDDARIADNAGAVPSTSPSWRAGRRPISPRCRSRPWCATCARPVSRRGVADRRHLCLQPYLLRPDAPARRARVRRVRRRMSGAPRARRLHPHSLSARTGRPASGPAQHALPLTVAGLRRMVQTALATEVDVREQGGQTH